MFQSFKSQPNTIKPTCMMTTCSTYRSAGADSGISVWVLDMINIRMHTYFRGTGIIWYCAVTPPPFPEFTPVRLGIETAALFLS